MSEKLLQAINQYLSDKISASKIEVDELTVEVEKQHLLAVATILRDHDEFQFKQLIDLCGIDFLTYGQSEWVTEHASSSGFERGRQPQEDGCDWQKPRFAVVYHLLSVTLNHRIRLVVFVDEEDMMVPSIIDIWNCANWYEREAFDLYGLLFEGHPDLRRILTDYGFIGHPFRKDFPMIGELEMRYDEQQKQCIYEPVSIEERILVPRVIRDEKTRLRK